VLKAHREVGVVGCVLVLLAFSGVAASGIQLDSPSSAEVCGRCHLAIHEAWKSSAHARATESRLFQDALELAEAEFGAGARKKCLECHAPVAVLSGDLTLRQKVSWEGVTCDYCHSIQSVSTASVNARATVEFSQVKSGPSKDASSTGHGTSFSGVHTSSLACVACHQYRNALGFPVLTTYSEWKNSGSAKEGKQCQSCHMYRVEGNVVEPRIRRVSEAKINLHQMPGSHTLKQLNKTVRAKLSSSRESDQLKVFIDVINRTAGHYVPTGSPMRQLVLELRADSYDGRHFRGERTYRRTVADKRGNALQREHVAFFKAAKVLSDTRLAPGEVRREEFSFPIPAGVSAQVKATFRYFYSPAPYTGTQERVTFLTISRLVR
jgi:hypothetical protein